MFDKALFEEEAARLIGAFSGTAAFSIRSLDGSVVVEREKDRLLESASVGKTFILGALLEACAAGKERLDRMLTLKESDITGGSGALRHLTPGLTLSVRDTAMLMVITSDNTATNMILDLLGGVDAVKAHMQKNGAVLSRVNRKITDDPAVVAKGPFSQATAGELSEYLYRMESGLVLPEAYRAVFDDCFLRQQYKDMFPRYLPLSDVSPDETHGRMACGCKTGFTTGTRADAGFIRADPGGSWVYALLANGCADRGFSIDNEASVLFAKLGSLFLRALDA
ncbi:MAG: serine hydrolase [Clostridia bacterium]|nr:serine hydrolase [Clostridia bacterium]